MIWIRGFAPGRRPRKGETSWGWRERETPLKDAERGCSAWRLRMGLMGTGRQGSGVLLTYIANKHCFRHLVTFIFTHMLYLVNIQWGPRTSCHFLTWRWVPGQLRQRGRISPAPPRSHMAGTDAERKAILLKKTPPEKMDVWWGDLTKRSIPGNCQDPARP